MKGFKIGHFSDTDAKTGVTVIICEKGATGGVDVRGSAPGTRETDLLCGFKTVDKINAVCFSGGSAFGLAACDGVMQYLNEKGIGFSAAGRTVPIVSGAVIFDLDYGKPVYPDKEYGYRACENAVATEDATSGDTGAGCGATVGKILGVANASKGGVGICERDFGGFSLGAAVITNSFGDIFDLEAGGKIIAGAKTAGGFLNTSKYILQNTVTGINKIGNTTVGCVFTDAKITREQANKLAELAQNGLALSISPVHTMFDGDTMFVLSSCEREADFSVLTVAVTQIVRESVLKSVTR